MQSSPLAAPLTSKSGVLFFTEDCSKGQRRIALFHYTDGSSVDLAHDGQIAYLLGAAVVKVHCNSANFNCQYIRNIIFAFLLAHNLLTSILPFLKNTDNTQFMKEAAKTLDNFLAPVEASLLAVLCQGDRNPSNFHMNNEQQITVFDFDQCGYGP